MVGHLPGHAEREGRHLDSGAQLTDRFADRVILPQLIGEGVQAANAVQCLARQRDAVSEAGLLQAEGEREDDFGQEIRIDA